MAINTTREILDNVNKIPNIELQLGGATNALLDEFEYMGIWLPNDFPKSKIPFKVFRDLDGVIKHDFNISTIETGTNIYWSELNGSDTNDGLTTSTPVKKLERALAIANSVSTSGAVINVMDNICTRLYSLHNSADPTIPFTMNKDITIKATQSECYMGTIEKIGAGGITFTADGASYKATRSAVAWVLDKKYKDSKGEPVALTKVNSVAECQATLGSWYTDGTSLWIRRKADETIDSDVLVLLNTAYIYFTLNGHRLILDGLKMFYNYYTSGYGGVKINGNSTSEIYINNCSIAYGGGNGLENINVGKTFIFNSRAYRNGTDGFNYHETPASANPFGFVFEFMCEGYENGNKPGRTQGINNGSTAHDGIAILRIGTKTWENEGANIVDVNSCYSVCIDCLSYNSKRPYLDNTKAAFFFNSENGLKTGKVYLINCKGGGTDTYSVGSDGLIEINVHKFAGKNIDNKTRVKHF